MKLLKHFVLVLLLSIISFSGLASTNDGGSSGNVILKRKFEKPGDRPRVPELQSVSCMYDDGLLIIEFAVSEGNCEIYVQPEFGTAITETFDSSDLITTVWVGEEYNEIYIEIHTEKGNEYSGTITLD
ncbi:MAG: hypothetical protein K2M19_04420 [Muribaculaceae bacterium]|nr:hypothetical protein [Muribaculaceae bacterium]